jgi:hypothetical protein
LWTVASNTIFLHSWHSLDLACVFLVPSTLSLHHLRDFPLVLVPSIIAFAVWFGILSLGILSAWPYHLSQRVFINFTSSSSCNILLISWTIVILHRSSLRGLCIFLTIFL